MERDYVGMAGPAFLVLIGLEVWIAHRRGWDYYRLNDTINDISTGLLMQLTMLVSKAFILAAYFAIYANFRVFDFSASQAWTWAACFLGVDFGYYWFHRLSHEINFLWAAHVVHHQSEDYNLAVALRQSTLQPFFSSVFYWPLALLGFPPLVFLACAAFNTIYQFWLHTQAIGTLGPLEAVFVTPSHHRVHHGRNPIYIDRNHGGTFIVWDRLFGTFEQERETVVYGLTTPLSSWNPVWANLHYWVELFQTARRTRKPLDKIRTFLKPPGWFPEDLGGFRPPPPIGTHPTKFDLAYPRELREYAIFQFALLVGITIALGSPGDGNGLTTKLAGISFAVWGLLNLGGLFEGRPWSFSSEAVRVLVAPALALALLSGVQAGIVAGALGVGIVVFAVRLMGLRGSFQTKAFQTKPNTAGEVNPG